MENLSALFIHADETPPPQGLERETWEWLPKVYQVFLATKWAVAQVQRLRVMDLALPIFLMYRWVTWGLAGPLTETRSLEEFYWVLVSTVEES